MDWFLYDMDFRHEKVKIIRVTPTAATPVYALSCKLKPLGILSLLELQTGRNDVMIYNSKS